MPKRLQIVQSTQSPMNPKRWLATLACGHEQWISRSRRPAAGATVVCPECPEKSELQKLADGGPVVCILEPGK